MLLRSSARRAEPRRPLLRLQ